MEEGNDVPVGLELGVPTGEDVRVSGRHELEAEGVIEGVSGMVGVTLDVPVLEGDVVDAAVLVRVPLLVEVEDAVRVEVAVVDEVRVREPVLVFVFVCVGVTAPVGVPVEAALRLCEAVLVLLAVPVREVAGERVRVAVADRVTHTSIQKRKVAPFVVVWGLVVVS